MNEGADSFFPEKAILALHAACDGNSLWAACRRLLAHYFEHHFLVGGFSFLGDHPMVIKRTKPAPKRDAAWWARNMATHPMLPELSVNPDLKVRRLTDAMPVDEMKRHPYYREFVEPEGWLYSFAAFFRGEGRIVGMLAVNRREDQGDFSDGEMDTVDRLYPHFETAFLRVAAIQADRARTAGLAEMVSRLPLAIAILSWKGGLVYINNAARAACLAWRAESEPAAAGLAFSEAAVPAEVVDACRRRADERDSTAVPNVGLVRASLEVKHPENPLRRAVIEPFDAASEPLSESAFLVRFEAPGPPGGGVESLALLSRLSTAEKAVAERILLGESNREIAAALGKSEGTVRKQVESILKKLGVRDRRRLMLAIRGGPVD